MLIGGVALFILAAVIITIWVLIEVKRMKHKIFAIFLIGLILFTYLSGAFVFQDKQVDYKTVPGLMSAGKIYMSWLTTVFANIKVVTTNVIKMDWKTNSTSSR
ncbi:MAG: hypothetical protein KJ949_02750 [Nanoarchaeota archaeon]|nr:hypothetical protein [Nanoarchaeota archaeon]MBU4308595.1 hypothetical protein [Nanoarchaeota archaeon]